MGFALTLLFAGGAFDLALARAARLFVLVAVLAIFGRHALDSLGSWLKNGKRSNRNFG